MQISKTDFFKRQTTLSEIGEQGQELLQKAKVLVIGCGGLGSPVAIYLASSGVGHIHLVDFDTVSISNLHRQVFYNVEDVRKSKVEMLSNQISRKTPFTKVTFTNKAVDKESILALIEQFDIVVDGTDSLSIKYLINDACVLMKKPLVYGSLYKFDGYVASFNVEELGRFSCNLRDAFPKITTDIPNCEEAGTMNPIVGIIALMQVNEVIKLITKKGKPLTNQLLIYNALENSQFKMKLRKNDEIKIHEIFKRSDYLDTYCKTQDDSLLISSSEFRKIQSDINIEVISVLNHIDTPIPFEVHQKIPYKMFNVEDFEPNFNKKYVVICKKGITSFDVVLKLKKRYPEIEILSLANGIENY